MRTSHIEQDQHDRFLVNWYFPEWPQVSIIEIIDRWSSGEDKGRHIFDSQDFAAFAISYPRTKAVNAISQSRYRLSLKDCALESEVQINASRISRSRIRLEDKWLPIRVRTLILWFECDSDIGNSEGSISLGLGWHLPLFFLCYTFKFLESQSQSEKFELCQITIETTVELSWISHDPQIKWRYQRWRKPHIIDSSKVTTLNATEIWSKCPRKITIIHTISRLLIVNNVCIHDRARITHLPCPVGNIRRVLSPE
jgi:hypothetical protein